MREEIGAPPPPSDVTIIDMPDALVAKHPKAVHGATGLVLQQAKPAKTAGPGKIGGPKTAKVGGGVKKATKVGGGVKKAATVKVKKE